uniref:Uncharacterized protein n=1 Tax=Rhizophora mucronata TaxID=61149 RepID=A0A2P2QD63_RHIMU
MGKLATSLVTMLYSLVSTRCQLFNKIPMSAYIFHHISCHMLFSILL